MSTSRRTPRYAVVWAPSAVRDFDQIIAFVAQRDGSIRATNLYRKIRSAVARLDKSPLHCRVVPELRDIGVDRYRELLVAPYRVLFRVQSDEVGIVSVLDGRRDLTALLLQRMLD